MMSDDNPNLPFLKKIISKGKVGEDCHVKRAGSASDAGMAKKQ